MLMRNATRQCCSSVLLALLFICCCCCRSTVLAKIYDRCDLARELHYTHRIPLQQIATWVCIAQRESRFDTSSVGRLNSDGSADHGIFQISDLFWCSHNSLEKKACGLQCKDLLDNDIANDVRCIKSIFEEHTRLSGDGFNAWTTYQPFCRNQNFKQVAACFPNLPAKGHPQVGPNVIQDPQKITKKYSTNPFLSNTLGQKAPTPIRTNTPNYQNNPFLNRIQKSQTSLKPNHPQKSRAQPPRYNTIHRNVNAIQTQQGKVYTTCSLAQELYSKHSFPLQDIATWVCIAEHQSSFDTSAVGRQNGDGSANYGLFQISDRYWCSSENSPEEKACNVPCHKLMDDDLTDDVRCVRAIFDEHTRISGDGFNAWAVYATRCQNQNIEQISQCFDSKVLDKINTVSSTAVNEVGAPVQVGKKGKIYQKCELAKELYHQHQMPLEQIPTWVCIAQHESNFKTAAVGRLNTDGSADHGLFQISDLYWCSHDPYGGKACNIPCDRLLDSDITDDVRCIKIIHDEHTRISGDGFNAWAVYKPHCQNQGMDRIKQCFSEKELKESQTKTIASNSIIPQTSVATKKGKVYNKCELAQELYHKHQIPIEQIPTWVCIAQHESSYNTAAVGRLNTDGSADHGLFQISDLYWCSHDQYGGKACNIPCDKLLDSDITDDVRCIKIIHEEHTRISGDGFNAWAVYKPHCRNQGMGHMKQCFSEKELKGSHTTSIPPVISNFISPQTSVIKKKGKIYNKCELAQELYHKHQVPIDQIPTWVCIAQHESSYNTAAVGRLNTDGSADHGLFQISDLYWCSHDQYGGKACNIPCDKLLDSDITDDVRCIKMIHEEHTRISGDGFNAWTVYKPHCRNQGIDLMKQCFSEKEIKNSHTKTITPASSTSIASQTSVAKKKGKIYNKCELAQELYHKHRLPIDQIPTWVCIAQHESSYNTAAVGRLNTDGSADHGLFQISDLYWCSHDQHGGKACNIPCDKLLDSDITDDVRCIKMIHEEHTGISGDGFNAWTVYKPHCRNKGMDHIKQCFSQLELSEFNSKPLTPISTNALQPTGPAKQPTGKGKIYKKCELAQELYSKHKIPMEQIPTWVCIAQHESSFKTAAVGRLNTDGSADHGIFQISDLYWCSHEQYGGKACNIPCDKLLDSDITDDVQCIKIIHDEHTGISGDGFNAWAVYKPHCRNRKLEEVRSCFSNNEIELYEKNRVAEKYKPLDKAPIPTKPVNKQDYHAIGSNQSPNYANNPFLQNAKVQTSGQQIPVKVSTTATPNAGNYYSNPFLNGVIKISSSSQQFESHTSATTNTNNFQNNPFLSGAIKISSGANTGSTKQPEKTMQDYKTNPFLSGAIKIAATSENKMQQTSAKPSQPSYNKNPFLAGVPAKPISEQAAVHAEPSKYLDSNNFRTKPTTAASIKPTQQSYNQNPFLAGSSQQHSPQGSSLLGSTSSQPSKYLDSNNFRTKPTSVSVAATTTASARPQTTRAATTTSKPKTTTAKPRSTTTTTPRSTTTSVKPKTTTAKSRSTTATSVKPRTTTAKPRTSTTRPTTTSVKPKTTKSSTSAAKPTTTTTATRPKTTTTTKHTTAKPRITTTTTTKPKTTTYARPTTTTAKPRTTTIPRPTTTTAKPTTTTRTTTTTARPRTTTYLRSTTTKPRTTTTAITTKATTKSSATTRSTSTSRPPTTPSKSTTTWSWNNAKYKQRSTSTTTKKPTTTTRKPSTTPATQKTTTRTTNTRPTTTLRTTKTTTTRPTTTLRTTKTTKSTTTTTKKPTTWWSTTTRTPVTTTTVGKPTTSSRTTTTIKPTKVISTTKSSKSTTGWSWESAKLKEATTEKPTTKLPITTTKSTTYKPTTTLWTTTRKPTTSFKPNTSWSWNNGKTQTPSKSTTTTKQQTTTTKRPTQAWSWHSAQHKELKTSNAPNTPTTTTKRPTQSTAKTTTTWSWDKAKLKESLGSTTTWTTTKPTTSRGTTKHPTQAATKTTTTWSWDKAKLKESPWITTTKSTAKATTTTKIPLATSTTTSKTTTKPTAFAWQQQKYTSSTATKPITTTTKRPTTTTAKRNWQEPKYFNATTIATRTTTTKIPATTKSVSITTTKPTPTTWQHWQQSADKTVKTTTKQQYASTTSQSSSGKLQKPSDFNKPKDDPFKHPFFERVRQQQELLRAGQTGRPNSKAATIPQDFKESRLYASKTIVSYNYTPVTADGGGRYPTTTMRP